MRRTHHQCQTAIENALAHGNDGLAEYLQTRCDLSHHQTPIPRDTTEPDGNPDPEFEPPF